VKASELIDLLRAAVEEHGDVDVLSDDWNENYLDPFPVSGLRMSLPHEAPRPMIVITAEGSCGEELSRWRSTYPTAR
jgi:hypothetical protein